MGSNISHVCCLSYCVLMDNFINANGVSKEETIIHQVP